MKTTQLAARVGDTATYEDMANAPTAYVVVGHEGTEYELRNLETRATEWSDLRQCGWTVTPLVLEDGPVPAGYCAAGWTL